MPSYECAKIREWVQMQQDLRDAAATDYVDRYGNAVALCPAWVSVVGDLIRVVAEQDAQIEMLAARIAEVEAREV